MTNQKTMTIAEYQLRRAELNGCEVHHRGYRVVSVTSTMSYGQVPEYWLETEGGCGSFAGTEILTITQRNTLNSGKNTGALFATIEAGLNTVSIAGEEAQAALATLRQRVADLETFYQHMVGSDYQNTLMDTLKDEMWRKGLEPSEADVIAWRNYDALLERLSNGT